MLILTEIFLVKIVQLDVRHIEPKRHDTSNIIESFKPNGKH